jgi:proline racemase
LLSFKKKLGAFPFLTLGPTHGSNRYRYANMIPGGRTDRSPCGTDCAMRAAILYEKGKIQLHEEHVALSINSAEFRMNIYEEKLFKVLKRCCLKSLAEPLFMAVAN